MLWTLKPIYNGSYEELLQNIYAIRDQTLNKVPFDLLWWFEWNLVHTCYESNKYITAA